jgi:hypothetical protein
MELKASDIDDWWNLVHDLLQKDLKGLFDEHKAHEASYRMKVKAYKEAYP